MLRFVFFSLCLALPARASADPAGPAFAAASVRRVVPPRIPVASSETDTSVSYRSITLLRLLMRAYSMNRYQVVGPSWLVDEHYDVIAKFPDHGSKRQIPEMLQQLLAERFHLVAHRELRPVPVYVLSIAKGGLKIKPFIPKDGEDIPKDLTVGNSSRIHLEVKTLDGLASSLSPAVGRPILNETGTKGLFDIVFDASVDISADPIGAASAADLPSVSTALHVLGLQIEPRRSNVEHLVVDKADRLPTEN